MKFTTPKDKFGNDMMIKVKTSEKGGDRASRILAICRGIRHILTPLAWVAMAYFAYLAASPWAGN